MKYQIKPLEKSKQEILLELDQNDLLSFKEQALKDLGSKLTLPGYREGKAPLSLVENHVSQLEVAEKAALYALEKLYPQIILKEKINALGEPLVSLTKLVPFSLAEFKIEVTILPELKLPDYKQIAKQHQPKKENVEITEEEINEALKWLQKTRTKINPETKTQEIPEINDAFAQSLGPFKSLEELKDNLKISLKEDKENKLKEQWRLEIMDAIIQEIKEEIPELLIKAEQEKMLEELKIHLSEMQLNFEDYLKEIKKTEDELRSEFQPLALRRVKMALVLKEIAQLEKIEVKEEETQAKVEEILNRLPHPELKNQINLEELKIFASGLIRNEKVFELLEKEATQNSK